MDKKKVKELIQEVIRNNVDSLEFGNDKHNAPLRKANSLLHDVQSAEYFKENILPNEVEITHDDGNYFEVSVNGKSYSCDVYGNGDFYHSIAEFKLLED